MGFTKTGQHCESIHLHEKVEKDGKHIGKVNRKSPNIKGAY